MNTTLNILVNTEARYTESDTALTCT